MTGCGWPITSEAVRTGARLVHSCGFDSIPHDLGALFCVQQLPEGVPLVVEGFVRAGGTFSGGTFHSAVTIMGRLRQGRQIARERRRLEGGPAAGRRVGMTGGAPRKVPAAGGWALPAPTIDPQVVLHSAAALERYGPDFRYGHYIVVKQLPVGGRPGARDRGARRPGLGAANPQGAAAPQEPG